MNPPDLLKALTTLLESRAESDDWEIHTSQSGWEDRLLWHWYFWGLDREFDPCSLIDALPEEVLYVCHYDSSEGEDLYNSTTFSQAGCCVISFYVSMGGYSDENHDASLEVNLYELETPEAAQAFINDQVSLLIGAGMYEVGEALRGFPEITVQQISKIMDDNLLDQPSRLREVDSATLFKFFVKVREMTHKVQAQEIIDSIPDQLRPYLDRLTADRESEYGDDGQYFSTVGDLRLHFDFNGINAEMFLQGDDEFLFEELPDEVLTLLTGKTASNENRDDLLDDINDWSIGKINYYDVYGLALNLLDASGGQELDYSFGLNRLDEAA